MGVFTGILVGDTNMKPLLESTFFGQEVYGFLCDSDGKIIASTVDVLATNTAIRTYLTQTMVHSEDLEGVEENIAAQIRNSDDYIDRVKYRIVRKDGAIRMIDDIGRKVYSENGSSVFYVCIVDVTDSTM